MPHVLSRYSLDGEMEQGENKMKTLFIGEISTLKVGQNKRRKITLHNLRMIAFYFLILSIVLFDVVRTVQAVHLTALYNY